MAEEKSPTIDFPSMKVNISEISKRLDEEIELIKRRIEKRKDQEKLVENLKKQEAVILKQKEAVKDLPDFDEYINKMKGNMDTLISLGREQSKLEKEYQNLLENLQ